MKVEHATGSSAAAGWAEMNRAALSREFQRLRVRLSGSGEAPPVDEVAPSVTVLARMFELSAFERDVVVMCAGATLEPAFAAALPGGPTFGLALAKLDGAHFDAASLVAPLRAHRLVALGVGDVLSARLTLDERILQFLLGVPSVDERVLPVLAPTAAAHPLTENQQLVASRAAGILRAAREPLVIQLVAGSSAERTAVASSVASELGLRPIVLRASALPGAPVELESLATTCDREALLSGGLLVIQLDAMDDSDVMRRARAFADRLPASLVVSAAEPITTSRTSTQLEIRSPDAGERLALWRDALGTEDAERLGDVLARIAEQFRLDYSTIRGIVMGCDRASPQLAEEIWSGCLERSRGHVDELARRVVPTATWNDLVLPDAVMTQLRDIGHHLRHRHRVHEAWGFARGESRGQAITALFCGPSGTGKTLAAEVIARDARLDLYHVDLSQVVDKYVGETEKRLSRIFDAADRGGGVLLFDEADALFGKRGDIERGTDRWANLEVSYLLQRMERYRGLAILTTNAKDAIDSAFMRRLRFVVQFPYPDAVLRAELWRRVFPTDAPTAGIQPSMLARLQLTGANIKTVALKSAVHAAADESPITMAHVVRAARSEFAKLEVSFPEAEVRSWSTTLRR